MVVAIAIEDTGSGVPEAVVEKVFDPFFTTKPSGQGTGLGLAVSKMIVELHGGAIDLRNRAAGGVQVTLWLKTQPVREAPRMARDEKRPATNRRGRGKLAGDRG
jgi:signal transduction histidine kinase